MKRVKRDNSMKVRVLGFDPAFSNFGVVVADLDLKDLSLDIVGMHLIKTEKLSGRGVKVSTDNLRRGREIYGSLGLMYPSAQLVFSEIPQGSQSAKACTALGIAVGILCCSPLPIIEVTPIEVKKHAVGKRTASKEEMIGWATSKYPDGGWKTKVRKGVTSFTNDNEHLADAIAVIETGLQTEQFKDWRDLL